MDLHELHEPFPAADVEWRLQTAGKGSGGFWARVLAYITNRAIQERLDEVCGPTNWRNEFQVGPMGGVLCGISIRCGDEWVTKWDGAENTDIEAVKGGLSNAMKRAAVQWGIGRYLYNLEEGWATCYPDRKGSHVGQTKDKEHFTWDPPALPDWALPGGSGKPGPSTVQRAPAPQPAPTPEQQMYTNPDKRPGQFAGQKPSEPVGVQHTNAPDFLDTVAPGKKAEGKTWRELIKTENGRGFVEWAIKNMTRLDYAQKEVLTLALAAAKLGDPDFSEDMGVSPLPF